MQVIDVVAIAGSLGILATVVLLAASGRLKPRYALLWLVAAAALVTVSVWRGSIDVVGDLFGIKYKPALVFLGADVFLMLILLHVSVVVSRLTERTRVLAQELALLRSAAEEQRRAPSDAASPMRPGPGSAHLPARRELQDGAGRE